MGLKNCEHFSLVIRDGISYWFVMDPLDFIVSALAAGAAEVKQTDADKAVKESFATVKQRLLDRFGTKADIQNDVEQVERKPSSPYPQALLKEELQTVNAAADRDLLQLAESLIDSLRKQGRLPATFYQAMQTGSGAVAQGPGAIAGGAGSVVVGGNFKGNVYQGSPPKDHTQALAIYRRMLVHSCRQLPLRGIDVGASDPASGRKQLDLDQVYVGLDTTTRMEAAETDEQQRMKAAFGEAFPRGEAFPPGHGESRPLSALEAAAGNRRLVLLGDPGSGKSTFVNHLGLCRAGPPEKATCCRSRSSCATSSARFLKNQAKPSRATCGILSPDA